MATKKIPSIDLQQLQEQIIAQFDNLDLKDPASWPNIPRYGLLLATAFVVVLVLWAVWISGAQSALTQAREQEVALRADYQTKLSKAVNLDVLKKQKEQVQQYVVQLEKQLPSKAEMDALLTDINQSGLGRDLQFELFRPGQIEVKEYYAELPIMIRVTGRYHDIAAFASDVAHLSRIVTLNNLTIAPKNDGALTMDATAKTFRYLDGEEVAAQRSAATGKGGKK
jgi:type IV pilus assembly protein PilO